MNVIPVVPRGYCHGVVRAIRILEGVLSDSSYPRPIHLLGMIVHNQFVVDHFQSLGVRCWNEPGKTRLELLDLITEGTVVITAHGVGDAVLRKIQEKGLRFVDATCQDVYKTHDLIKSRIAQGFTVLYVGKKGHPESEGALSLSPKIRLLENIEDVDQLPLLEPPLVVTNQTTFSIREIAPIFGALEQKYPDIEIGEEICSATRSRQEALLRANETADGCIVVGDPHSNNTESLARLSETVSKIPTFRVASAEDVKAEWFQGMKNVTLTSGASTPPEITREVLEKVRSFHS